MNGIACDQFSHAFGVQCFSRIYKFDEINDGFKNLAAGTVARGVIMFD